MFFASSRLTYCNLMLFGATSSAIALSPSLSVVVIA
jgi:hypothetical protein